jgi:PAS domain S-box-containing protein
VVVDPQQRIVNVNPAFGQMFGWSLEEVQNKPVRQIFADDSQYHKVGRLLAEYVGPAPVYETVTCRRANGEVFPCEIGMFMLSDGEGRMTGMAGVVRDVTERVGRERLQQEQIAQLKALDRMKDEFLSVLSHELRTPLNGIMGFASILDDGLAGELSEDQLRYVSKIQESSDRMLALVNDLIDVSRIQAGKLLLDPRLVDFCEVTRGAIDQVEPLASAKGHTIVDEVPCTLPPVFADDHRVGQVLGHLLTNAIKFTPQPGVIRVRARLLDRELVCEVQDTGIGVPPEDRQRLFQRFAQLDGSYTRSVGGLGLGLFICKAIVEAHGGRIGVTDGEKGRGATFWFSLPLALDAGKRATLPLV